MARYFRKQLIFVVILSLCLSISAVKPTQAMETGDCLSDMSLQLARSLEVVLEHVAESVKALADEYVRVYEATPPMDEAEKNLWLSKAMEKGKTVSFRPFSNGPEPTLQAPAPGYLFYNGRDVTPKVTRELKTFVSMAPMFKAAYRTFHYSWVYMTTPDEAFLIYPYLTLDQAVNNLPPTKQAFYKAADFEGKTFGWEKPYLDLAGAGMMVTVSYPVYSQDKLLGVISRDMTLEQLSSRILEPISGRSHPIGLLMDRNGLAVAANNTAVVDEIEQVNTKAGAAVLYYRTPKGIKSLGNEKAVSSSNGLLNEVGEKAVALAAKDPNAESWRIKINEGQAAHQAAVARIPATGWLLLTIE